MKDVIKAIGFPITLTAMLVTWVNINSYNRMFDEFVFIISTVLMIFMWLYNRNEYLRKDKN